MTGFSAIDFSGAPRVPPSPASPASSTASSSTASSSGGADGTSGLRAPSYARRLAPEDTLSGLPAYGPRQAMFSQSWAGEHDLSPVARQYAESGLWTKTFRAVHSPKGMCKKIGHAFERLKEQQRDPSQPSILLLGEAHHTGTSQRALRETLRQMPAGGRVYIEADMPTMADVEEALRDELGDEHPTLAQRARMWNQAFAEPVFLPGQVRNRDREKRLAKVRFLELMDHGMEHVHCGDPKRFPAGERYGRFNQAGLFGMREQGMLAALRQSGPFAVGVFGAMHLPRLAAQLRSEGFNVQTVSFIPLDVGIDDDVSAALRATTTRVGKTDRTYVVPHADVFAAYDDVPASGGSPPA